jgi:AcrR family transcriptional regulator
MATPVTAQGPLPSPGDGGVDLAALFAGEDMPRTPQQPRARRTLDLIMRAAAELFAERGYSGTTTKDIAERAGVGVGTLYFYARDKRQLLVAMLHGILARYARLGVVDAAEVRADPAGYVREQLAAAYPYDPSLAGIVDAVTELALTDRPFRALNARIVDAVRRHLELIVEAARPTGLVRPSVDAAAVSLLAEVVYSLYNLTLSQRPVSAEQFRRNHAAATGMVVHTLFTDALPAPAPPKESLKRS